MAGIWVFNKYYLLKKEASASYSGAHPVFVSSRLGVHQTASPQLLIGFFRHRLAPLVRGAFAGHFHCQMREPAIGCSTVPVLDLRGNVHHIARMQLLRRFAPLLIVAPTCHADKDLPTALCGMVDVPVVPALNWTPPPQSLVVAGFNGIHICALCESFLTSSFYQVIFLFLPRSKPLLQG